MKPAVHRYRILLVCVILIGATLFAYWGLRKNSFVYYDDDYYITKNEHVHGGLTLPGARWAFTTGYFANWHPLTWISLMGDYQLLGLNPVGYHLTSLFFHTLNSLLLFFLLRRMTGLPVGVPQGGTQARMSPKDVGGQAGGVWESAFVAGVFALHPLHVESVAWAAEWKDVLSTLFWFLTLWAYVRYTERPEVNRYLLIVLFFALGLMAKPMLVTLPFTLLLLDYWPLRRVGLKASRPEQKPSSGDRRDQMSQGEVLTKLIREKIPLFLMAGASSVATFIAQRSGGAVESWVALPTQYRIANALVAYVGYAAKAFWPTDLAVYYPHPGDSLPLWKIAGAGLLLVLITLLALRSLRGHRYFAVGWFWYLGTLVPVIGIVQVGTQAMADRYMYIPLIGLTIILAWGAREVASSSTRRAAVSVLGAIALIACAMVTRDQVRYWQNTVTLFQRAIDATNRNWLAHYNLGVTLADEGHPDEAKQNYLMALKYRPDYWDAHLNLGTLLAKEGNNAEAIAHFSRALELRPDDAQTHYNIGLALAQQGKFDEAENHYLQAIKSKPDYAEAIHNLGLAYAAQGRDNEALARFSEAISVKKDFAEAHNNLAILLAKSGKMAEAASHFAEAVRIKPLDVESRVNLGLALLELGKSDEAITQFTEALRLKPDNIGAKNGLEKAQQLREQTH